MIQLQETIPFFPFSFTGKQSFELSRYRLHRQFLANHAIGRFIQSAREEQNVQARVHTKRATRRGPPSR